MECLKDRFYDGVILDGRFETISPLNNGSFGMVFMARSLETNEFVAIKCLTKKSADVDSSFAIDERSEELECHARLGDHPHTVNLIHSFETEAHIYIVLEFCSRGDLYEAIRNNCGPSETEHVRSFMLQLVDAVAYIHSKGMYHRDIKPENIFLTESGAMKLGDFGLATSDDWSWETNVGSDRYMSPEQYDSAGAGYAPDKADIWAIGICLLNILFRRNPFITPTESDPLFLDFSRDKQSLFDVFPKMSQDTYEIIAQCMSLDPRNRSLEGVREAIVRAVSFTVFDEPMDTFNSAERRGITVTGREPLRTPSIQSPQVDNSSFPWAEALKASPAQHFRQLSAIADDESYTEDLFPASEKSNKDWFSIGQQTPSLTSVLDSSLGSSLKPLAIRRPLRLSPPKAAPALVSGSLPVTISRPKLIPTMSSVFGKKDEFQSRSWNDMYEEDEAEADRELKARQEMNSRTWSHESQTDNDAIRIGQFNNSAGSIVNVTKSIADGTIKESDIDEDLVADGFFFHDQPIKETAPAVQSPRYSPPPKRTSFDKPLDKWAKLGERRRAYTGSSEEKSLELWKGARRSGNRSAVGLGFTGFGNGVWDTKANSVVVKDTGAGAYREFRGNKCPWSKDRVSSKKQQRFDEKFDLEWVEDRSTEDLHL